ncbi:MAG TPA: hypothetical protein VNT25_06285, partial [Allosphingosinicella sp.]|nr:hypothetical protein [Allosphingosinicella sp.]
MDSFRAYEHNADIGFDDEPVIERPPEIGVDERRMHVRAYNYWASLLDGRAYPSIGDVDPSTIEDFGPYSVLIDFTSSEDPEVVFIGSALRSECGIEDTIGRVSDVPSRSLLSRLTDHYLQIIANRAPIGFEAEFVGQRGHNMMYRGILMPLSSDGEKIDFIYGVINWKEVADQDTMASIAREVKRSAVAPPAREPAVWADGPHADPDTLSFSGPLELDSSLELAPDGEEEGQGTLNLTLGADAGLFDRLHAARESAEAVKSSDARSRAALYQALGQAYDFALASEQEPDDYAEILDDAGLKAQARAPMTPIVKLIFGADYDKTRLTEFAAALSYGRRVGLPQGGFSSFVERFDGGLKAVVKAERKERRPAPKPDPSDESRRLLRDTLPVAFVDVAARGESEFVLLLARRQAEGGLAV